jgi:hypothetical protein
MPTPPMTDAMCKEAVDAVAEHKTVVAASMALGVPRGTLEGRLRMARMRGIEATPKLVLPDAKGRVTTSQTGTEAADISDKVASALRRSRMSLEEIAKKFGCTKGQALDAVDALRLGGYNVTLLGDQYSVAAPQNPAFIGKTFDDLPTYYSRADGTYLFGACGDNHMGSKYSRLDVIEALYDWYAAEGVDRVFNTGNWIDGERRFNQHDLLVHGMDNQLRYLATNYPKRDGITTYAVAGDDHEGWYAQDYGVDVGKRAEQTMVDNGRKDWVDLGYMEAAIRLVHSQSGASQILSVVHPGGGSSYALSYSIQKIIESLEGGEKPAVGLYGHYHKLWSGNIRNVWCIQTGTTEDQTPFMRKKKLEAHVGGFLVKLTQDPKTGAIIRCRPEMYRFFNKGFYNNRWNHGGGVQHAERSI